MRRILGLLSIICMLPAFANGQRVHILDSESKAPVPFAAIQFGTANSFIANKDGVVSLQKPLQTGILQISSIGYKTKRIQAISDSIIYLVARTERTVYPVDMNISPLRGRRGDRSIRFDTALKATLDSIGQLDQQYRVLVDDLSAGRADSLAGVFGIPADSVYSSLMVRQASVDSGNLQAVKHIIKLWGYPGKSLVGTPANDVAYYVIQHSPQIAAYLPVLRKAARDGELSKTLVAMMEDRNLTEHQKEQVYGTQLWGNAAKDSATGVVRPVFYFYPIRDAASVNERRRKAGFSTTIAQYAVRDERALQDKEAMVVEIASTLLIVWTTIEFVAKDVDQYITEF